LVVAFDCGSPIRHQFDAALHCGGYEAAAQSRSFTGDGIAAKSAMSRVGTSSAGPALIPNSPMISRAKAASTWQQAAVH